MRGLFLRFWRGLFVIKREKFYILFWEYYYRGSVNMYLNRVELVERYGVVLRNFI